MAFRTSGFFGLTMSDSPASSRQSRLQRTLASREETKEKMGCTLQNLGVRIAGSWGFWGFWVWDSGVVGCFGLWVFLLAQEDQIQAVLQVPPGAQGQLALGCWLLAEQHVGSNEIRGSTSACGFRSQDISMWIPADFVDNDLFEMIRDEGGDQARLVRDKELGPVGLPQKRRP